MDEAPGDHGGQPDFEEYVDPVHSETEKCFIRLWRNFISLVMARNMLKCFRFLDGAHTASFGLKRTFLLVLISQRLN